MEATMHDLDDITVHVASIPHADREPTRFVDIRQRDDEFTIFASFDRQEQLAREWLAEIAAAREQNAKAGESP